MGLFNIMCLWDSFGFLWSARGAAPIRSHYVNIALGCCFSGASETVAVVGV